MSSMTFKAEVWNDSPRFKVLLLGGENVIMMLTVWALRKNWLCSLFLRQPAAAAAVVSELRVTCLLLRRLASRASRPSTSTVERAATTAALVLFSTDYWSRFLFHAKASTKLLLQQEEHRRRQRSLESTKAFKALLTYLLRAPKTQPYLTPAVRLFNVPKLR